MKIAYLTTADPTDIHNWSGLTFNIAKSLKEAENELVHLHSFKTTIPPLLKVKQKIYPKLTGKFLQPNRHAVMNKQLTPQIEQALGKLRGIELIFSNSSELIAATPGNLPKAFWVDASFAGMLGYYTEFSAVHADTLRQANKLEQLAYDKASFVFFASDWAAETARKYYRIAEEKIFVVPFGANITTVPSSARVAQLREEKRSDRLSLLFSGVDWQRKGGETAVEITRKLNEKGIPAQLFIVGSTPFAAQDIPPYVTQVGFLSKKDLAQQQQYSELFEQAHFLVMPSKAECYGLVYCEANAYGVPAIGCKTGGVPTIIKDGVNGVAFDVNAPIEDYAEFIKKYWSDQVLYRQLAENSRLEFENRLNWDVAGKVVTNIMKNKLHGNA